MLEYFYFFGEDIPLHKYKLGIIHQPTLLELLNEEINISEFVYPFYMAESITKEGKAPIDNILFLLMQLDTLTQNNESKLLERLRKSLKLMYQTDNIEMKTSIGAIIINDDIVIDEDNFQVLSKIVLEMTMTEVKLEKKKDKVQEKLIEEMERRKKKFEKEYKVKSEMDYVDMFNLIIHMLPDVDYSRLKSWTIYQVKNTYKTLTERYNYETCVNAGALSKDIKDWRSKLRIKNSEI